MKWSRQRRDPKEIFAHPVCHFMRRFCDSANAGAWRSSNSQSEMELTHVRTEQY
jgi:hypothetical protein